MMLLLLYVTDDEMKENEAENNSNNNNFLFFIRLTRDLSIQLSLKKNHNLSCKTLAYVYVCTYCNT